MSQIARRSFIGLSLAALASAALPARIALAATPARASIVINIRGDASRLEAALVEFNRLFDELASVFPDAFAEQLCAATEVPEYFIDIRQDRLTALPAGEVLMILEPSEFFNRLLAALRARDFDVGIFVELHNSASVGLVGTSNEERASTESQGLVGACPPKSQGI